MGVAAAVSVHAEPEPIVTAPVTVTAIAAEIVNVAFVAVPNVIEARGLAGATLRVGCEPEKEITPIRTTSPAAEPGFPVGLQLAVVAHAVLVVPTQL